jgi:hypothetical protein
MDVRARTLEPQPFEINEKSGLTPFFTLSRQTWLIQTDPYDAGMFLNQSHTPHPGPLA